MADITSAWDNRGDITVGNDVWIGYEAVILAGVTVGDGAIIAGAAVVGLAGGADPGQSGCHSIRTVGSNQMTCFAVMSGLSRS